MKRLAIWICGVVCTAMLFCGCSSQEETAAKDEVRQGLDALKQVNTQEAGKHLDYSKFTDAKLSIPGSDTNEELDQVLLQQLEYDILETEVNGEKATVTTKITNRDFGNAAQDFLPALMELAAGYDGLQEDGTTATGEATDFQTQSNQLFNDILQKEENTYSSTVDIYLEKKDGQWVMETNGMLVDAVYGGLVGSMENILKNYQDALQ